MKKITSFFVLILAFNGVLFAQKNELVEQDKKAIKEVVEQFYIDVVFGDKNIATLKNGFHSEFNMYVLYDDKIDKRTLQRWTDRLEQVRSGNAQTPKVNYTYQVKLIDVTGPTAMIKIEIYGNAKLKYTDYLSLYKFKEGWKIMTKLFTQHE